MIVAHYPLSIHADAVTLESLRVNNESSVDVDVVIDITRANVRTRVSFGCLILLGG